MRRVAAAASLASVAAAPASWSDGLTGGGALQMNSVTGVAEDHADKSCTIVANLHVRKCGGTSVRNLFQSMEDWTEMQAGNPAPPAGRFWMEVHDDEDVANFNQIVEGLKTTGTGRESQGFEDCKVISTLLLRNAVDQAMSEWFFFYKDQDHSEQGYDPAWSTDMFSYVMAHPENELRWLTMDAMKKNNSQAAAIWHVENPGVVMDDVGLGAPVWSGLGSGISADCTAAAAYSTSELAKVDLVGTMDTPEEFAAFWLGLGNAAGFTVLTDASNETSNAHVTPDGVRATEDTAFTLAKEQRARAETVNKCTQQVIDAAKARHTAYTQANVKPGHVDQLMTQWRTSNFTSVVGHEHEEMKKTPHMIAFPPVESWESRRARVEAERLAMKTRKTDKAQKAGKA